MRGAARGGLSSTRQGKEVLQSTADDQETGGRSIEREDEDGFSLVLAPHRRKAHTFGSGGTSSAPKAAVPAESKKSAERATASTQQVSKPGMDPKMPDDSTSRVPRAGDAEAEANISDSASSNSVASHESFLSAVSSPEHQHTSESDVSAQRSPVLTPPETAVTGDSEAEPPSGVSHEPPVQSSSPPEDIQPSSIGSQKAPAGDPAHRDDGDANTAAQPTEPATEPKHPDSNEPNDKAFEWQIPPGMSEKAAGKLPMEQEPAQARAAEQVKDEGEALKPEQDHASSSEDDVHGPAQKAVRKKNKKKKGKKNKKAGNTSLDPSAAPDNLLDSLISVPPWHLSDLHLHLTNPLDENDTSA